jgi:hypothetical protein
MIKEVDIQGQIMDVLDRLHIFHWRNNTGGFFSGKRFVKFGLVGSGDILGILPGGRFFSIETKKPKGKTDQKREEKQIAWMESVNKSGGLAIKVQSVEDVLVGLGIK